ncbi:MAG: hypothetical protein LBG10_02820 [Treponema sp.]|jgi:hypothetical protein|nr:hypothetical protein [Treponema sp.]
MSLKKRYCWAASGVLLLLGACASTGDGKPGAGQPPLIESRAGEDINGNFPPAVYIKTRTQTFNTYHYYILKDGLIWYKSRDPEKEPREWSLFFGTGLPTDPAGKNIKTNYIAEISADADELVALSAEGQFFRFCFDWIFSRPNNVWKDRQGWPIEEPLYMDRRTAKNIAWALGKRNNQVLYYEDPFGNQHHNGTQEIATTYVLLEDGQEICYADTGLPGDFSRNYLGPEEGCFKSAGLSASASTIFLVNGAGEMYTRIADFDIIGCDPMFMKYTYIPYKSDLPGTDYYSNLTPWALPPEDWRKQPPIPLEGKAALTRFITILQNGQGNAARELRVAGYNEEGETGYWTKAIFADPWNFTAVPLYFQADDILPAARYPEGRGERGPSLDRSFAGFRWIGDLQEPGWAYEIPDFNILEGLCSLRVTQGAETCTMILHPVELWTYLKRDYLPGRDGPAKMFFVTLDIPAGAREGLSEDFARKLRERFGGKDKDLFHYTLAASAHYILIQDGEGGVIFLTDETRSNHFAGWDTWFLETHAEIARYRSPELQAPEGPVFTRDQYAEIWRRIEPNKKFLWELETQVLQYEALKQAAFGSYLTYSSMDLFTRITLLNYVEVPKIATITSFGKRILQVNKVYTDWISDTQIWIDKKLIELLKIRIQSYTQTAAALAKGEGEVSFPPGFAETIPGYLRAAGFPGESRGIFGRGSDASPAVLTISPEGMGFFGMTLTVGEKPDFVFFIEPMNIPAVVFSRKGGKTGRAYSFKGRLSVISVSRGQEADAYFNRTIAGLAKAGKDINLEIRVKENEVLIKVPRPFFRDFVVFQSSDT